MKIVNIDRENLHIFWTTSGVSMKFSVKMWLMIILKVTKKQGFTFSLKDTFLEKLQRKSNWPPSLLRVNILYTPCNFQKVCKTKFIVHAFRINLGIRHIALYGQCLLVNLKTDHLDKLVRLQYLTLKGRVK